jgi:hypothetical protein
MASNESKAEIWGPHYWFILHEMAYHYPVAPNRITKRKYYDFILNLPMFLPDVEMGNRFSELLDRYPVTPYLDSRESFIRWTVFIHNRVNLSIGKREWSLEEYLDHQKTQYLPPQVLLFWDQIDKRNWAISVVLVFMIFVILFFRG